MTPEELERQHTLRTATARFDDLRARDSLREDDGDAPVAQAPLSQAEALELLALSELIARKAGYGRQLTVRKAREVGASWSAIGRALGTTKQAAWEAHTRWIQDQAEQNRTSGFQGLDELQVARARRLAGRPDEP